MGPQRKMHEGGLPARRLATIHAARQALQKLWPHGVVTGRCQSVHTDAAELRVGGRGDGGCGLRHPRRAPLSKRQIYKRRGR